MIHHYQLPKPAEPRANLRSTFTTPEPVYGEPGTGYDRPEPISSTLHMQAMAAMHLAKKRYPGVVGEILAGEIDSWKQLGWYGSMNSPVARLVQELTGNSPIAHSEPPACTVAASQPSPYLSSSSQAAQAAAQPRTPTSPT